MAQVTIITLGKLQKYDGLIKSYIGNQVSESVKDSFKSVAIDGYTLKFYTVKTPGKDAVPAYTIDLPETDLSNLITKMTGAVAGDVVVAKADGTVADGGVKLADLAKTTEVETKISESEGKQNTKIQANTDAIAKLNGAEDAEGSVDNKIKTAKTALEGEISANKKVLDKLDGTVDTDGSVKKQIKTASDALQEQITANKNVLDKLDGEVSVEGSVKKQIADVKKELEQTITDSEYNDTEVRGLINANKTAIDTLNGEGAGSVKKAIDDAFNDFSTKVSDDGVVNTYKELIDYAAAHKGEAATMAGDISANKTAIANLDKKVGNLPEGTDAATVVDYADKVSAKALADAKKYSDDLAPNYATAAQGAKADTALQEADVAALRTDVSNIKTSLADGGATDTAIKAAKKAGDDAAAAVTALADGQVATNKSGIATNAADITAIKGRLDTIEDTTYVEATDKEIEAMFAAE